MAAQQVQGIGPMVAVDRQADDPFVGLHLRGGKLRGKELGVENGRNTVLAKHGDYFEVYRDSIKARSRGGGQIDGDCFAAEIEKRAADLRHEHHCQYQPRKHEDDYEARLAQIPPD